MRSRLSPVPKAARSDFPEDLHDLAAEGREIVRFPGRDQVPVPHHLLVDHLGAGVPQIVAEQVRRLPLTMPAEARTHPAWQMAATILLFSCSRRTSARTASSWRRR